MKLMFNTKNLIQYAVFLYVNHVEAYHKERTPDNSGWMIFTIHGTWQVNDQDTVFNDQLPKAGEPGTVDVMSEYFGIIRLKFKYVQAHGLSRIPMLPDQFRRLIDAGDSTEPF